jgi:DNA-binding transcriptional LysR family regulator
VPNWDDIRYFLALAEAGSQAGAGRQLGVKHTTVARRVQQLEDELDVALIMRSPDGIQLTDAGKRALMHARTAAEAIEAMALDVRGADDAVAGVVRVAVSPGFAGYLSRRLAPLKQRYPELHVHLHADNRSADLSHGEADLAVRMRPTEGPDLRIRTLGSAGWCVYAAHGYLEGKPLPKDIADMREHPIIGFEEELSGVPGALWLREQGLTDNIVLHTNSIASAFNAALGGLGIAVLPCLIAEEEANLVRLSEQPVSTSKLSLVAHPDVLRSARVRAVWDYLLALVEQDYPMISGTTGSPAN